MDVVVNRNSNTWNIISWMFCIGFFIIGILNIFLVHIIPGGIYILLSLFYILLSLFYIPSTNNLLKKRLGFSISPVIKIIIGIIVLWGTLAVGDLMELFESRILG